MKSVNRNLLSGVLFGLGLIVFMDEVVFHQLLQWHHFYDKSTTFAGIASDGLLNSFGFFSAVFGLFMLADLGKRQVLHWKRWIGGAFLGAGGFQLYDGIIHHKLLQLHQIRYQVDILPYDMVWNISAFLMLLTGAVIVSNARRKSQVS
ncbi:DUF2243 domain-containing protein [Jeotgalibacillus haloalkalitolerans]|uniref:DUF2243 domain-containing protein n=1 Tax=Jeotgalibacillus haloalkalitolerans TaxID=3104292 RepID=A0ABU5KI28_9BACL|nr:DUF2243 domain-containing protein [Jeotgalibacillus sp. HH7-29]MDZ5710804.1 DUF2243 domain-containing protein [Jeotgalibacillus sp. HH7-29]